MTDLARAEVALCERYAVADVDSHIIEPADLWTSRVSSKWGDLVPHVQFDERRQEDRWYIGVPRSCTASARSPRPAGRSSRPRTPSDWPRRSPPPSTPKERLAYMDKVGVYYQLLYPNILGFHSHVFLNQMDHASWPPSASGPTTTG